MQRYGKSKDSAVRLLFNNRTFNTAASLLQLLCSNKHEDEVSLLNDILSCFKLKLFGHDFLHVFYNNVDIFYIYRFILQYYIRLMVSPYKDEFKNRTILSEMFSVVTKRVNWHSIMSSMFELVYDKTNLEQNYSSIFENILKINASVISFIATSLSLSLDKDTTSLGKYFIGNLNGRPPDECQKLFNDFPTLKLINKIMFPTNGDPTIKSIEYKGNKFSKVDGFSLLREIGTSCMLDQDDVKIVLDLLKPITEENVACCLATMSHSSLKIKDNKSFSSLKASMQLGEEVKQTNYTAAASKNVNHFVKAVNTKTAKFDWDKVLLCLDNVKINIEVFSLIAQAYKEAKKKPLPASMFVGNWQNKHNQCAALLYIAQNSSLCDFSIKPEGAKAQMLSDKVPLNRLSSFWRCVDFVQSFFSVCHLNDEAQSIYNFSKKSSPQIIFSALILANTNTPAIISETADALQLCGFTNVPEEIIKHLKIGNCKNFNRVVNDFISRPSNKLSEFLMFAKKNNLADIILSNIKERGYLKLLACCEIVLLKDHVNHLPPMFKALKENSLFDVNGTYSLFEFVACVLEICETLLAENQIEFIKLALPELSSSSFISNNMRSVKVYANCLLESVLKNEKEAQIAGIDLQQEETDLESVESEKKLKKKYLIMHTKEFEKPPILVQDKINFLITNTDPQNVVRTAEELVTLVRAEYFPYFADYYVTRRISLEMNHHEIYYQLLKAFNDEDLLSYMRIATVEEINRVLNSDRCTQPYGRKILKALGAWYGKITLAQNIPIEKNEIDLKKMLFNSLEKGKLNLVLPFVSKVLESCKPPSKFSYPDPWILPLLLILFQLHRIPQLTLTLKFEIEFLFRELDVTEEVLKVYPLVGGVAGENISQLYSILHKVDFRKNEDFRFNENDNDVAEVLNAGKIPNLWAGRVDSPLSHYEVTEDAVVISKELEPYIKTNEMNIQFRKAIVNCSYKLGERDLKKLFDSIKISIINCVLECVKRDLPKGTDENVVILHALALVHCMASNMLVVQEEIFSREFYKNALTIANQLINQDKDQSPATSEHLAETIASSNFKLVFRGIQSQLVKRVEADIQRGSMFRNLNLGSYAILSKDSNNNSPKPSDAPVSPDEKTTEKVNVTTITNIYGSFYLLDPVVVDICRRIDAIIEIEQKMESLIVQSSNVDRSLIAAGERVREIQIAAIEKAIDDIYAPFIFHHIWSQLFDMTLSTAECCRRRNANIIIAKYCASVMSKNEDGKTAEDIITDALLASSKRWHSLPSVVDLFNQNLINRDAFDTLLASELDVDKEAEQFAHDLIQIYVINRSLILPKDLQKTIKKVHSYIPKRIPENVKEITIKELDLQGAQPKWGLEEAVMEEWKCIYILSPNLGFVKDSKRANYVEFIRASDKFCARLMMKLLESPELAVTVDGEIEIKDPISLCISQCAEWTVKKYLTRRMHRIKANGSQNPTLILQEFYKDDSDCFEEIDMFLELIKALMRFSSSLGNFGTSDDESSNKWTAHEQIFKCIIDGILTLIKHQHKISQDMIYNMKESEDNENDSVYIQYDFYQKPLVRIISNLLIGCCGRDRHWSAKDPHTMVNKVLPRDFFVKYIITLLDVTSPLEFPAFTFGWLDLVAHRILIEAAIISENSGHRVRYLALLIKAFDFIRSQTGESELSTPVLLFSKGLLKLMLVILHDCPLFFVRYYQQLCDVIPLCCSQHRNAVLTASPPASDMMGQTRNQPAAIDEEYLNEVLQQSGLGDMTSSIVLRGVVAKDYVKRLRDSEGHWNIKAINAVVPALMLKTLEVTSSQMPNVESSPITTHLCTICCECDTEERYYFLNAIFNQIRYESIQSLYFSRFILFLLRTNEERVFTGHGKELAQTKEQCTRILIERVMYKSPAPRLLIELFLVARQLSEFWLNTHAAEVPAIKRLILTISKELIAES